jgi:uncharacterized MAPEG superfamily protein
MSVELTMLAYSVALLFVLINIQAGAAVKSQGGKVLAGNRDNLKPPSAFEGRSRRTLYNHMEAMALFAPLVLTAAVSGISNDMTVLGAQLFFYARILFAAVYLIGIPYVRTALWLVGIAGIVIIFLALFGIV